MAIRFDRQGVKPKCSALSRPCGGSCVSRKYSCKEDKLPTSEAAKSVLAKVEDEIRNEPIEHLVAVDPATGEVRLRLSGDETSVDIPSSSHSKIRGAIVTHNHPNIGNWKAPDPRERGYTFSPQDIHAATSLGMKEVRAVTTGYDHSMIMPDKKVDVRSAIHRHHASVYTSVRRDLFFRRIDQRAGDQEYWHRMWTKVAAENPGMVYTRTEIGRRNDAKVSLSNKEILGLVSIILKRSYGQGIKSIRIQSVGEGQITGVFADRTKIIEFLLTTEALSTRLKYSIVGKGDSYGLSPAQYTDSLEEAVRRLDAQGGRSGIKCGKGWISSRKVCRLNINTITSPSERKALAIAMASPAMLGQGTPGIEDSPSATIRDLQKEARSQGIPYANQMTKEQLRDTIRSYKASPKSRDLAYKALSKKKKAEESITNSQFAKDWKTANKILKMAGSGGVVSGVAVAAILANRTVDEIEKAQADYSENFPVGARRARAKGRLLAASARPMDSNQHHALMIVGGATAEEGRAEDIQAEIQRYAQEDERRRIEAQAAGGPEAGDDTNYAFAGYLNNQAVTRQYLFNPSKTDFEFEGSRIDPQGRYTPQYLARLGIEGVGLGRSDMGIRAAIIQRATGGSKSSGNDDSIDLAAQIYAHFNAVSPNATSLSSLTPRDLNKEIQAMNRTMPDDAQYQSLPKRPTAQQVAGAKEWLTQRGWTGSRTPNKNRPMRIIAYGHGGKAVKEAMELLHAMGDPDRQMLEMIDIAYLSTPDFNFTKERARREASFIANNDPYSRWNHRNPERFPGATDDSPRSVSAYFQSPQFRTGLSEWMGFDAWAEQQRIAVAQERATRNQEAAAQRSKKRKSAPAPAQAPEAIVPQLVAP